MDQKEPTREQIDEFNERVKPYLKSIVEAADKCLADKLREVEKELETQEHGDLLVKFLTSKLALELIKVAAITATSSGGTLVQLPDFVGIAAAEYQTAASSREGQMVTSILQTLIDKIGGGKA